MSQLLFHHGWAFPWIVAAVVGLVTWLVTRRGRGAPSWRPSDHDVGPVVLDGHLDAPLRLPGGNVVDADGTSAGQCVLRRPDGRELALVGPIAPLDRVPRHDREPPVRAPLRAGLAVRVRATCAPAPASGGDSVGYREVARSLQLVPRDDDGAIEIARRDARPLWAFGLGGGALLGLLLPGLGLLVGYPELGFASPLFRDSAIEDTADGIHARIRGGDPDAVRDVAKFLTLEAARGRAPCADGSFEGAALPVVRRFGELCEREDWLPRAINERWKTLGEEEARAWLRTLHAEGSLPDLLLPTAARLELVLGEAPLRDERVSHLVEAAQQDSELFARFVAGAPDALAPTLLRAPEDSQVAHRVAALALARCGTSRALPICEKAMVQMEALAPPVGGFSRAMRRDLLRWGPMLTEVAHRTESQTLDPRVKRLLLERVTAYRMLMRSDDEAMVAEVRAIRERMEQLASVERRQEGRRKPCAPLPRPRRTPPQLLPEIAVWLGSRPLLEASVGPHDPWIRWLEAPETPRPSTVQGELDTNDHLVATRLRQPREHPYCISSERLPDTLDLLDLLDARRVRRARCGSSPEHDRWVRLLSDAYLDPTRGPRLARLEAAFVGLAPERPLDTLPLPPRDTETTEVVESKPEPEVPQPADAPPVRSPGCVDWHIAAQQYRPPRRVVRR